MNLRASISEEELRYLYFDKHMTQEEIAAHFGCGTTTIKRRMIELGIEIRPRGPEPGARVDFRFTNPEWSGELAYVVGVLATDGNLSQDGRHITLKLKDLQLIETIRDCLKLETRIVEEKKWLRTYYRLQWSNSAMHSWLVRIGLTPAKTFTLGPLQIPDAYFRDFLRGAIDGDGCILMYQDRWNTFKSEKYVYERVYVSVASASHAFLVWLQSQTINLVGLHGAILTPKRRLGRAQMWEFKFAKKESLALFRWIYHDPNVPSLLRKKVLAMRALERENS